MNATLETAIECRQLWEVWNDSYLFLLLNNAVNFYIYYRLCDDMSNSLFQHHTDLSPWPKLVHIVNIHV